MSFATEGLRLAGYGRRRCAELIGAGPSDSWGLVVLKNITRIERIVDRLGGQQPPRNC